MKTELPFKVVWLFSIGEMNKGKSIKYPEPDTTKEIKKWIEGQN
jgi:hypothetical protein